MLFAGNKIKKMDDSDVVRFYKNTGDNKYLAELYDRYIHLVYGVCLKYLKDADLSKDAALQVFEKLMTGLKTAEINNFRSWLYTVVKNHCLMQLRSAARQHKRELGFGLENELTYEDDENKHEELELQLEEMKEALLTIKPEQKTCIELFYLQGKCYNEICALTGFDLNQVKSYIQNGKRNLKLILTKQK